jgi:hypothetical protein
MEKTTIYEIINDLKAKRDALSLAHEQLKKDNDDWNKCIIVLSLMTGMIESAKIRMGWNGAGVALIPVMMSSIIASVSALIKFKKFPEQMEVLIQSTSILTMTLNKCRNHTEIDQDILKEYHDSLEQLETSVYPDIRKKYLKMSHKNLIDIMKQEQKYFNSIGRVNDNEKIEDDVSTISDKDKQQRFSLDRITNPLSSNIRKSFELNDIENGNNSPDIDLNKIDIKFRETIEPLSKNELSPLYISLN